MSLIIVLKVVHVVAVILAVGANASYVFWLRIAGRDRARLVYTINGIRWLDRRLANPAYGLVLATGLLMVLAGAYSFDAGWIRVALVLYVAIAVLGITVLGPAIRRQLAEAEHDPSTATYAAAARRSRTLGALTTAVVLVIVVLMVAKPF